MARGRKSFVDMMSTNPYKVRNAHELYTSVYQLTSIANKRIEKVNKAGYKIIRNNQKYYINMKTGLFDMPSKSDSVDKLQRRYQQLKNFMNSPGNDVKKIKREKARIRDRYKGENITEDDYKMYRSQAGYLWQRIDEEEKMFGLGSGDTERIIIRSIKTFKTFKARLNYVQREMELAKRKEEEKRRRFEEAIIELNKRKL